jgi:magnesium transporter
MLRALLFHRLTNELRPLAREELLGTAPRGDEAARTAQDESTLHAGRPQCRAQEFLWVDVIAPDEEDFQLLTARFHLHPMIVEDIRGRENRPKLHDYEEYLYLTFHAVTTRESTPQLHEIDCLVGPDYVVTIHDEKLQPLLDLHERWKAHPQMMQPGPAYLLYELMDEVLDDYFPALDVLDERIDELEARLFDDKTSANARITAQIFSLKRDLLQIRRVAGPTRDVVNVLLRRDAERGGKNFAYFQDLYDHAVRIVDMTDTFRDVLSGALDAYLAVESNRMNAVMKTLTAASIILLIPNLIAAIFGMNFERDMPHYGFHESLLAMIVLVLGLGLYFKRKGWI